MKLVECEKLADFPSNYLLIIFFSDGELNKFIINVFVRPDGDEIVLLRKRE